MRRRLLLGVPALLLAPPMSASAVGQRLGAGGHVLLMRHAEAPGVGDPPGFRIGDCRTQRNLSAAGREQARAAGRWLRSQGLQRAQVWSSPWCRCLDTARLLDYGEVTVEPSLSSFFGNYERGPQQREALQAFVARLQGGPPGPAPVLVTHQVVISAYAGGSASSAEMVLVRVDRLGQPQDVIRYAPPMSG
jgi:broad specificity phosphatase PhoE